MVAGEGNDSFLQGCGHISTQTCVCSVNGPIAWTYRNLMGQVEEEKKGCEDRRRSC